MKPSLILLGLLALGGCSARDADHTADRKEILDGEKAWGQAFVKGDAATIERLLASDFLGVDPTGVTYDRARMLNEVRTAAHSTSDDLGTVIVRFYGDTAIAQGSEREVGPPPEKAEHVSVWTDVWVKKDGHWKIEAAEDVTPGLDAGG